MSSSNSLFEPVASENRWHADFRILKELPAKEPARVTMDAVFARMGDRDGNFRQQFQTSGFDSRVWELYLFTALQDAGYEVDQPDPAPDFLLHRGTLRWAVEATTAHGRSGEEQPQVTSQEELLDFLQQKLPIQLGSPLFSKLQRRYTEHEDVVDLPFVLALE